MFIDLQTQVKVKINSIQTISFSTDGTPYTIFPAIIQGTDVKLYSFHARSNFIYMEVSSFQGQTSDSFSYSLGIDLDNEVKDKINLIKTIQKEPTNVSTYIYILLKYLIRLQLFYQFKQLTMIIFLYHLHNLYQKV